MSPVQATLKSSPVRIFMEDKVTATPNSSETYDGMA
jgi:hypothetical protein